ncbi:MAG: hypothetical protein ACREV7_03600 [Steroidobacteraceae bacterium]
MKLIVTRGPATVRGYAVSGSEQATRLSIRYPWPVEDPVPWQQGVSVRIAAVRLGENRALAGLKHCNRLEQTPGPLTRRLPELLQPLLEEPADG